MQRLRRVQRLAAAGAVGAALSLLGGCAGLDAGPSRAAVSDDSLTVAVRARLGAELGSPHAEAITVETTDGVVRLQGAVESDEARARAAATTAAVDGVRRIENRLTVR